MALLTEIQREVLNCYNDCLWAIVAQAVEDATGRDSGEFQRECPWSPCEAAQFLQRTFGPHHRITRGVLQAIREGREIRVSVHDGRGQSAR
jgi:hypothetical protein